MRGSFSAAGHLFRNFGQNSDVFRWMEILRRKHAETYRHCVRVALLGEKLAIALPLDSTESTNLIRGCFIHDLGKILIPLEVLDKDMSLTDEQWKMMKQHPQLGVEMLENGSALDAKIIQLVQHHHERWDGKGYPKGLQKEEIPLLARVCSVIDAFDSMLSERPYRKRKTVWEAMGELQRNSGTQFDPFIVERFKLIEDEVIKMYAFSGKVNECRVFIE
ncbi:HD-GYP domain-containing protein [Cohnella silvisoli]|uniref:HD domain-containing protein n=1 Tax=Cohnella silvisoli TaxID=2873699 RepID=A0ABV1KQW6_9BACL|nr:HD domain-containing phosphohydrolase [Cohnella silvisoli]